jgi:hypothetical protein
MIFDVVTFGEAMIRLSPPAGDPFCHELQQRLLSFNLSLATSCDDLLLTVIVDDVVGTSRLEKGCGGNSAVECQLITHSLNFQ